MAGQRVGEPGGGGGQIASPEAVVRGCAVEVAPPLGEEAQQLLRPEDAVGVAVLLGPRAQLLERERWS